MVKLGLPDLCIILRYVLMQFSCQSYQLGQVYAIVQINNSENHAVANGSKQGHNSYGNLYM